MKKTILKKSFFIICAFFTFSVSAQTYTFSSGLEGWDLAYGAAGSASGTVTHSPTEGTNEDGALVLTRESNNSNFGLNPAGIDASTKKIIKVKFKNETNATQIRVQGSQPADNSTLKLTNTIFNIGANSTEYVTMYLDMTNTDNWNNTIDNLDFLVRVGYASGEGKFYLDEIAFLTKLPPTTYSEFIQNPSFDGPSGIAHLTGVKPFADRAITTTEKHDGDQSLKTTFSANADEPYWAFSDYEKTYATKFPVDSDIQIKMWVKTNRNTAISIGTRVKLTDGGVETATKPIANVTTTNTAGEWKELTFDLKNVEEFDGISFWFAVNYTDAEPTNLMSGDIVYFDQMTATITEAVLNVKNNILEEVSIYPNPVSDVLNVKCPKDSKVSLFNVLGVNVATKINASNKLEIPVKGLSKGIYLLKIESDNKSKTSKVIIK